MLIGRIKLVDILLKEDNFVQITTLIKFLFDNLTPTQQMNMILALQKP